ncbi:MAG: ABC transporter substrate-binding protein [Deltaproteobacteria bacterium]|nr:ABC transporter substrate-binding protein [Deltaproteobacteria bacterium]
MAQEKARLKIIYRSNSHAALWVVADKAGIWAKNNLGVDTSPLLVREKAVEALKNGHVDLISGNHHNLYVRNAKRGEDFVHLAQATNNWTDNRMVVADGIKSVQELRGKRVAIDKITGHGGLNMWLFLRQEGLDADRGDIELVSMKSSPEERWKRVLAGEFAATFVGTPHDLRAARAGARVIRVRAMPMIRGVTLTTTMTFVKNNEEQIRRLIRGLADAIHFFLTQKDKTLKILKDHIASILHLENDEEVNALYNEWVQSLGQKPYPSLEAIGNVFELALKCNPEVAGFNPLAMWNTHYVRELDDSGYIERLYR